MLLIDIESYVRQLLPPNRRQPVSIGLATLLFRPVVAVVERLNGLRYDAEFDLGTPGQTAVLEYILQAYVHPNCRVLEGDGVAVDFRVLVPSPNLYGPAREIVERYKLPSKRYQVSDVVAWGGGGASLFAFAAGYPAITYLSPNLWNVAVAVNEPGTYQTRIVNQTTGKVFIDQPIAFGVGLLNFNLDQAGTYRIQVANLVANKNAVAGGVVCDLIWLDQHPGNEGSPSLATRWQGGTRQIFVHLYSIRANLQPFVTRIWSGATIVHQFSWNNPQGQWLDIPSLANGTYSVDVADKDGCVTPKRTLVLASAPATTLAINSVASLLNNGIYQLTVNFQGGTPQYTLAVITAQNSQIYSSQLSQAGQAVFNLPANTQPQTVLVRVTDAVGASSDYNNVVLANGNVSPFILFYGFPSLLDIEITGQSNDWLITDNATASPPGGHHWWYWVGAKVVRTSTPLSNEPWEGNHPGEIFKLAIRSEIAIGSLNLGVTVQDFQNVGSLFDKGDVGAAAAFYFH